jgi:hypothetical protein
MLLTDRSCGLRAGSLEKFSLDANASLHEEGLCPDHNNPDLSEIGTIDFHKFPQLGFVINNAQFPYSAFTNRITVTSGGQNSRPGK